MAYDKVLADRIRELIDPTPDVSEKKMFGGVGLYRGVQHTRGPSHDLVGVSLGVEIEPMDDAEARAQR